MTNGTQCPDPGTLQQLLLGRLAEGPAERLEQHILRCERCSRLLASVPAHDTLVEAMRGAAGAALPPSDQTTIQALIPRLQALRVPAVVDQHTTPGGRRQSGAASMIAAALSLDFLRPAEAPGELGRLGPYCVLKVLGQGGMGIVFLAEDPQLQRTVALKVMQPEAAQKATARQRFLREARAMAKIEHDHIVTIYQVGEDRGIPFLAMQLLKGMSLEEFLKKRQGQKTGMPMTVDQALKLGREVARGLGAAHEHGLIHRDIKPANIWLDATAGGRVKILDFGLARAADGDAPLTRLGTVVGTVTFMAPEQARNDRIDGRADLFSLGCVLYRLCTGRLPWKGPDLASTIVAVATAEPIPVHQVNPDLPPKLAQLIMQLLAKKPDDRPASARAVVEAIQAVERYRPAQTVPLPVATARLSPPPENGWNDPTIASGVVARPGALAGRSRRFPLRRIGALAAVAALVLITVAIVLRSDGRNGKDTSAKNSGPAEPFTNTIGMKFVPIAPGKFLMGSLASEQGHQADELQREVVLTRSFYMGAHPVTVGQVRQFIQGSSYQTELVRDRSKRTWKSPGFDQTDDHPVVLVSWNDAVAFCAWLGKKEGRVYRLPTEAEWEYCCRAGTRTAYWFGDDVRQAGQCAWTSANAGKKTHPVGQLRPNGWGLYDMHGNVWQWTNDWYAADYFQRSPKEDPPGPGTGTRTGPMGPTKVLRGGSFSVDLPSCRSAIRKPRPPNYCTPHSGFRIVCDR